MKPLRPFPTPHVRALLAAVLSCSIVFLSTPSPLYADEESGGESGGESAAANPVVSQEESPVAANRRVENRGVSRAVKRAAGNQEGNRVAGNPPGASRPVARLREVKRRAVSPPVEKPPAARPPAAKAVEEKAAGERAEAKRRAESPRVEKPMAPVAFAAENVTNQSFLATWGQVSGGTSCRLDVATDANFNNRIIDNQSTTHIAQTISGLTPGTQYHYRVRVVTSAGVSLNSNTSSVQTAASAPGAPASLWFDMPMDVKINGVWTKVYDGVPDEIIPSGAANGLTYYVLDWRYTGGSVTFGGYDDPINDWWSLRTAFLDTNGDGSWDDSRGSFTPWWLPSVSFTYLGETWFRLGVEFNPQPGHYYDICYSKNDVISGTSLSRVNGGAGIYSDNTARLIFALFNEFTGHELDHGSLYLVRQTFAPAGVKVTLPTIGDVVLRKGPGGVSGAVTVLGDVTIETSASSATIRKPNVGSVTVSNGTVSGSLNIGGGHVISANSSGITLTTAGGAVISTGPGGTSMTLPGGIGISVSTSGAVGMTLPAGAAGTIRNAIDQIGIQLGLGMPGGPTASAKVIPHGGPQSSGVWDPADGVIIANRPAGDYDLGIKESTAPDSRALWIRITILAPPMIVPESGMIGVVGDMVPSTLVNGQRHFVTPKKSAVIPQDYVVFRAQGISATGVRESVRLGDGAERRAAHLNRPAGEERPTL